jgi:hypothetical protein
MVDLVFWESWFSACGAADECLTSMSLSVKNHSGITSDGLRG